MLLVVKLEKLLTGNANIQEALNIDHCSATLNWFCFYLFADLAQSRGLPTLVS